MCVYVCVCLIGGSCKGRCSESFKRGRECDCDPDCDQFNKCCPDHKEFCSPEGETVPVNHSLCATSN